MGSQDAITIAKPDDWHLHLRDGDAMRSIVGFTADRCGRAIVMPNLRPPVATVDQAMAYRDEILGTPGLAPSFDPLMTLYLRDDTTVADIKACHDNPHVHALKLYPAGATTNSDSGVTQLKAVYPVLEAMEKLGIPLLVHGEVTDPAVDIFDREAVFIQRHLEPLISDFPGLKVVLEHITTGVAVDFVTSAPKTVAATITAHHLMVARNQMLVGGIRPHLYCLPILKREEDRLALVAAATSGNPKFFLGTDSAPHETATKESSCGCAGVFTAHATIELYAEVFDAADALDRLEGFASTHGPDFYGLPHNSERMELVRRSWTVPESYPMSQGTVKPFRAGETIAWSVDGISA